jgi:non-specific serine/threonine protein kinase
VLEGLASLLDKSMIYKQEVFGEAESADERFNMLKVLRDYALERLGQDGQEEFYRQQHASYYLNLAETAERELKGPQQVVWLERLETEHDNLRAALSWTLQKAEITSQKSEEISSSLIPHPSSLQSPHPSSLIPHPLEMAVRFGAVLWRFWQLHSHLSEGRQWLEAILERVKAAETAGSNAVPLALQAKLLHGTGLLAYYQGQHMQAVEYLEQSLAISRELGDKNGIILALQHLGLVNLYQGEAAQATGLFEEVLALRKELKDKRGIALTLNDLGNAARQAGKFERADELLGESLKLFEELGNKEGIAIAHRNLGHVAYQRGDFEQARTIFETGLNLFRELGSKASVAQIMQGLAGVAARQGRAEEASRLWQEAQELLASTGAISDPEMQLEYSRAVAKAKTPEKPTGQQTDSVKNQPAVATGPARTVPHPQNESAGGSTFGLTNRELEVLRLVAQGLTNAQVAENLVVAPRTVNVHLTSIYTKLRVNSRTAATRYAIEQRLV